MPDLIATTAFGLEAVVDRELERLGYADRAVEDGRITFSTDEAAIARANLWLRSADRLLVRVGEFTAVEFGELFDRVEALPWEDWLPKDAAIGVEVRAVRSPITSPRSAQSIVKKAIVTRLGRVHHLARLPETGPAFPIDVSIRGEVATVAIDTSGDGLHKRGYRTLAGPAPLKETLAAGLIQLSYWNRDRPFADPFCGSGTLPIEAALIGRNLAPGLNRRFLAEDWPGLPKSIWSAARAEANDLIRRDATLSIIGTDIDETAIGQARRHAAAAGVAADIHFQARPFAEFRSAKPLGCLVCNPPYGERLGDRRQVESLYRAMNEVFGRLPTWSLYVLTAHPDFPRLFHRRPDRRRKLYNGRLECTYYQYAGPRPPRRAPGQASGSPGVDAAENRPDDDPVHDSPRVPPGDR